MIMSYLDCFILLLDSYYESVLLKNNKEQMFFII